MKNGIKALAFVVAMAVVAPASAQIVNGGTSQNGPAPVATKGASTATMGAPGEAAAAAGAAKNNAEFKAGQALPDQMARSKTRRRRAAESAPTSN